MAMGSVQPDVKLKKLKKKKRRAPAEETVPEEEEGSQDEEDMAAEERLAAIGDAFMNSIEGFAPPRRQTRRASPRASPRMSPHMSPHMSPRMSPGAGPSAAPSAGEPPQKKRRRNKPYKATKQSAAAAPIFGDTPPAPPKPPRSPQPPMLSTPASAASSSASRPDGSKIVHSQIRMSAAEKRRFMSGKVSDIRSSGQAPPRSKKQGAGGDPEEDAEFRQTLRDVLEFVTPQLGKRERKQYEDAKLRALGAAVDPNQKVPYAKLKTDMKRHEEKRQAKLEEDRQLGVSTSASGHRMGYEVDKLLKKKKEMEKDKKKRQGEKIMSLGMGAREKNGMATISKTAIRSFNRRA